MFLYLHPGTVGLTVPRTNITNAISPKAKNVKPNDLDKNVQNVRFQGLSLSLSLLVTFSPKPVLFGSIL
jgi:hypothetical protein